MAGLDIFTTRGTTVAGREPSKWEPGRVVCPSEIQFVCLVDINKLLFFVQAGLCILHMH